MSKTILFNRLSLSEHLKKLAEEVKKSINQLSESEINGKDLDYFISGITKNAIVKTPKLNEAGKTFDDEMVLVETNPYYSDSLTGGKVQRKKTSFYIPFTGDSILFFYRPSEYYSNPPEGEVENGETLVLSSIDHYGTNKTENILAEYTNEVAKVHRYLTIVQKEVELHNTSITRLVDEAISYRRREIEKSKQKELDLGIKRRSNKE